jgi:hypothetical protein
MENPRGSFLNKTCEPISSVITVSALQPKEDFNWPHAGDWRI